MSGHECKCCKEKLAATSLYLCELCVSAYYGGLYTKFNDVRLSIMRSLKQTRSAISTGNHQCNGSDVEWLSMVVYTFLI